LRSVGDAGKYVGEPAQRIDVIELCRHPRSEPAKSHDFRPNANPRSARSASSIGANLDERSAKNFISQHPSHSKFPMKLNKP